MTDKVPGTFDGCVQSFEAKRYRLRGFTDNLEIAKFFWEAATAAKDAALRMLIKEWRKTVTNRPYIDVLSAEDVYLNCADELEATLNPQAEGEKR